jgi:hypothetical protein
MTLIFMTVGFSDPSAPANVYRLNPVSLVRWRDNGAIARNSQHIEALLKFSVASTTYASIRLFISSSFHLPRTQPGSATTIFLTFSTGILTRNPLHRRFLAAFRARYCDEAQEPTWIYGWT